MKRALAIAVLGGCWSGKPPPTAPPARRVVVDPKPLAPEYANAVGPPCEPSEGAAASLQNRTDQGLREARL